MNKKTLIIAGGSILGILLLLILVVWLMTVFKGKYLSYEKVEDKIVEATKKYYKEKPELLPVTDGRYTLSYDTLVEGEYIKPLNEMLRDGDNCTAEIYVIKSGSDYTYAPKLDCGDNYTSVELYKQVLAKTDIVDVGSGLYQDEDGNYYFKGKVSNNYVALGHKKVKKETKDILWQIISISSDGTIKIRSTEPTEEKYLYDNRFNKDRNSDSGYNDFEDSVLHESMNNIANNHTFLTSEEQAKLKPMELCIGKRTEDDITKDGSTECSLYTSDKMIFGTLTPYEYMRASLDENCVKTTDKSCSNFNFISNSSAKEQWFITASPVNSYQAYEFDGRYFRLSTNTKSKKVLYLTTNISEYTYYKGGTGTKSDPYRLFKEKKK